MIAFEIRNKTSLSQVRIVTEKRNMAGAFALDK